MRWVLSILILLLAGCSGSGTALADPDASIRAALQVLEAGIDREDPILASQPIGQQFFLGTNIGTRYSSDQWDGDEGKPAVGRFRSFFNHAFEDLVNLDQQFTVESIDVNGEVVVVEVTSRFDAVRIDQTPAENITFSGTDYMAFELENGSWRLVRWDEQPPAT